MEDVKPSIASLADDGGAMEARVADACKMKAGYMLSGLYGSDWEKRLEMDALLSPSSKALTDTRAHRKMSGINDRPNSGRKVNGRLNFGVKRVSPNDATASPSTNDVPASNSAVTAEQLDS